MLTEGQVLEGKYRVERLLSEGGMGAVFIAEHTRIKRRVAVKVLHRDKIDAENTRRFEQEAEAAGRIGSDHIVDVLDFGSTPDGDRFMVMEFLVGETLKERLKTRTKLPMRESAAMMDQLLAGLIAAHDAGIVHRDLKPDNIFIVEEKAGRKDFLKIVDFGISKFGGLSENGMTQTGAVMGTPFYMSPEQARSATEADARSDLYSAGVILYEAVTGAKPFTATTLTELLMKIVFEDPPPPSSLVPDIDPAFASIIQKAMARDPAQRYQTAHEMRAALTAWASAPAIAASAPAAAANAPQPPLVMKTAILDDASYGSTVMANEAADVPMRTMLATSPGQMQLPAAVPFHAVAPSVAAPTVQQGPPAAKSSVGVLVGIAVVVMVGLVGGVLAFTGEDARARAAPSSSPVSSSAAVSPKPAEVPSANTDVDTPSTATAEATVSAPPSQPSTPSWRPPPAPPPPTPVPTPPPPIAKPKGTVSDLGY